MRKTRLILTLVMVLVLLCLSGSALALVKHTCGLSNCICFIQLGDKGKAVSGIIDRLYEQGYLPSASGSTFTAEVEQAVMAFQKDHKLKADGKMTDNTLTYLLYGMSVKNLDTYYPELSGDEVWVSTDGGTRFHSNPTCSGMAYARKMSARNAQELGFKPCLRCWSY